MTEVYFSKTWSILGYHDTLKCFLKSFFSLESAANIFSFQIKFWLVLFVWDQAMYVYMYQNWRHLSCCIMQRYNFLLKLPCQQARWSSNRFLIEMQLSKCWIVGSKLSWQPISKNLFGVLHRMSVRTCLQVFFFFKKDTNFCSKFLADKPDNVQIAF